MGRGQPDWGVPAVLGIHSTRQHSGDLTQRLQMQILQPPQASAACEHAGSQTGWLPGWLVVWLACACRSASSPGWSLHSTLSVGRYCSIVSTTSSRGLG